MNLIRDFKSKKGKVYERYKLLVNLSDRIDSHHLYMLAAGIAFNILIYLIPLMLFAIYLIGRFYDPTKLSVIIESALRNFLPPTASTRELIHTVITEVQMIFDSSSIVGIIGIIGLLWISSLLVNSIRLSFNAVFHQQTTKIFIIYRLKDILLTFVLAVLIMVYSYVLPVVTFLVGEIRNNLPSGLEWLMSSSLLLGFSVISSGVLFYIIYRFVPNRRLPNFIINVSTLICVLAIELSRHLFAWYITRLSNYGKFYGTYAVLVSLAVWIYYSALILLLSAEISKFVYENREIRKLSSTREEVPME